MKEKSWDEAIAHWKEAIQHSKGTENSGYYICLATSYLNMEMDDLARSTIEDVLKINPDSITLYHWMASFREEKKQLEKAKDAYKKIIPLKLTKERPRDYYYHANALVEVGNKKLLPDAERALKDLDNKWSTSKNLTGHC